VTFRSRRELGLAPAAQEQAARAYVRDRTGPLTSSGVGSGAVVRTSAKEEVPDVELVPTATPAANTWSLHVVLLRPGSRGSLRLRSADFGAHPIIRANYLSDERDLDVLVRGLAIARRLAGQPALAELRARELAPGPETPDGGLRAFVRQNATTFFHPVGTCRMGRDPLAVVDPELRVHGVPGLRVVDASVMPALVAGATHAATVMIAEKGADLVKKGW
jgi:choline dehydrogenase-like flavoprotein